MTTTDISKLAEDDRKALALAEDYLFNEDTDELDPDEMIDICWALHRGSTAVQDLARENERLKARLESAEKVVDAARRYSGDPDGFGKGTLRDAIASHTGETGE